MTEPTNLRDIEAFVNAKYLPLTAENYVKLVDNVRALLTALRETRAKGEQLASAINAYIGCEAPPLRKNGPYWKALAPALRQWAAVRKKVIDE